MKLLLLLVLLILLTSLAFVISLQVARVLPQPVERVGRVNTTTTLRAMRTALTLSQPTIEKKKFRAFNSCIAKLKGRSFLISRISNDTRCYKKRRVALKFLSVVGFSMLNDSLTDYAPGVGVFLLHLPTSQFIKKTKDVEDVRFVSLSANKGRLVGNVGIKNRRVMYAADISLGADDAIVVHQETLLFPTFVSLKQSQKNWTPFVYGGDVLYIFSVNPHVILCEAGREPGVIQFEKRYETAFEAASLEVEHLYGGTNVVRVKDKMMACVHTRNASTKDYKSVLYTFSPEPPFHVIDITPNVLNFDDSVIQYPVGMVYDESTNTLIISGGVNDCSPFLVHLDVAAVEEDMVRVKSSYSNKMTRGE